MNVVTHELRKALSDPSNYGSGSRKNEQAGAGAASTGDLFDAWVNEVEPHGMVSTKEAKKEYFLTTADLATLSYESYGGGIGCGPPTKCYVHKDLVKTSVRKHGRSGVVKKLEARHKREEKKRKKEEEAEQARKRLKTITNTSADGAAAAATATTKTASASDTQEIKNLRKGLLKMVKRNMGFQMSGAPKNWRIEVPGTSKATFAALVGRPTDVDLESFVKNGAYYTEQYEASKLLGTDQAQLTKNFNREGVRQEIGSSVAVRYKPSTMELSVSGHAVICGW